MKAASQTGKQLNATPARLAATIGEANGDTGVMHALSNAITSSAKSNGL